MERCIGVMVATTKDSGSKVFSMARVYFLFQVKGLREGSSKIMFWFRSLRRKYQLLPLNRPSHLKIIRNPQSPIYQGQAASIRIVRSHLSNNKDSQTITGEGVERGRCCRFTSILKTTTITTIEATTEYQRMCTLL